MKLPMAASCHGNSIELSVFTNQQYVYAYDTAGNLTSVTFPGGTSRSYLYNESAFAPTSPIGLMTGIVDENNQRYLTTYYDTSGRATRSEQAGGANRNDVVYNANNTANVIDTASTTRVFNHVVNNTTNRLSAVSGGGCNGCSLFASYSYDTQGFTTQTIDFRGTRTNYSDTGETVRQLETQRTEGLTTAGGTTASTRTISTQWHATFRLPALITETDRTTAFTYDANGNLLTRTITDTSVTPNTQRTWTYTHDSFGRVLTEDGPRTDVTDVMTYTYYACGTGGACGQIHTVTDALNHTTTYNTYNAHGQPLTITDANGVVTTLTYDARERLLSSQVNTETTIYNYWLTGLLRKVTHPDGSYVLFTYDNAHRVIRIDDGDGNHVQYVLDAMGNPTSTSSYDPSSALARTSSQVFNNLNQLWKQLNAAGGVMVTLGYDASGNLTSTSAVLARNTTNQYDELNRLKQITDPSTGITSFGYDANDNLLSVHDPRGLQTSYAYTGFGEVRALTSPDTGVTSNTYDSAGNLKTTKDSRNIQGMYSHDALNRVTSIAYPDQTVSFTYDAGANGVGRLTGGSDANHSLAWSYDANGRVVGKTQAAGGLVRSISYTYTSGNLTSIVTPSGQVIGYGYSNGRISNVSVNGISVLGSVLYEPFGDARQWTWGNGSAVVRTHDLDGNLTQVDSGGEFYGVGRDDAFRITSISNSSDGNLSWTYGYDLSDRLTSAASTPVSRTWNYDANGNRTGEGGSTGGVPLSNTLNVSGASNRLSSISGSRNNAYTYDAAGHVQTESSAGRAMFRTTVYTMTSYVYNALSQRIAKMGESESRFFFYDESGHLIGEYAYDGGLIQETVWMGDIPVATLRPHAGGGIDIYYVHTDQLNAPRKVTRPSGNVVVWRWDPKPFGDTLPNENPQGAGTFQYNLRFPGQYFDAESGLTYNAARDYDTGTGRYVESDPLGLEGGINTFGYVNGNPTSNVDPDGLEVICGTHYCGTNIPVVPPSHVPPPKAHPETKAYICHFLNRCAGNWPCTFDKIYQIRHTQVGKTFPNWNYPVIREAENFGLTAGFNWIDTLGETSYVGVYVWQYHKVLRNLPGVHTSSYSQAALDAALAGKAHEGESPEAAMSWCKDCAR
jgi:RHS repeat-associated protein